MIAMLFVQFSEKHLSEVTSFTSGNEDLDDYLKNDALFQQDQKISLTFLAYEELENGKKLLGYISILTDSIRINENSELDRFFSEKGIFYKSIPALRIGRLAIRKDCHRMGYGKKMVQFSLMTAIRISEQAGCRFLTVDSKPESVKFYKNLGFVESVITENNSKLYLDIKGDYVAGS